MTIDAATLEDVGLLRLFRGRWQYKFSIGSGWMTANTKADAIERASCAYEKTAQGQRLTARQRAEAADREEYERSDTRWGHMTLSMLRDMHSRLVVGSTSFRRAGAREFNSNGGRRTSAAVSNEAARDAAETAMQLGRYIATRAKSGAD